MALTFELSVLTWPVASLVAESRKREDCEYMMKWTGCFRANSSLIVLVCLLLTNHSIWVAGVSPGQTAHQYEDSAYAETRTKNIVPQGGDKITFKDNPDPDSEGSHHSRGGVVSHGYFPGYVHSGYDAPHYDEKSLAYYHHDYQEPHFAPDHSYHGPPQGYDAHGTAVKSLLLPLAGIALLGAAAALVTNPVLLQLGVVSGRRRRRAVDLAFASSTPAPLSQQNVTGRQRSATKKD